MEYPRTISVQGFSVDGWQTDPTNVQVILGLTDPRIVFATLARLFFLDLLPDLIQRNLTALRYKYV